MGETFYLSGTDCADAASVVVIRVGTVAGEQGPGTVTVTYLAEMGEALGDFDCDADVTDFAHLQRRFTGSGPDKLGSGCAVFDFEPDNDVDLHDFPDFRAAFTEP